MDADQKEKSGLAARQSNNTTDWQSSCESVQDAHRYLLSTGTMSDITFVVQPSNERVNAHKAILMSRSSVFEAMFQRWNPENSEVELHDTTVPAFNYFLRFLYFNEFEFDSQEARSVLSLAHKYNVTALAKRCADLMKTGINLDTVIDTYQIANLLDQADLKQYALDFMLKNATPLLQNISTAMKEDTFLTLLDSDELNAKEIDVFQAVIKWAELTCTEENLESSPANNRKVAEKLVPFIRFPLMNAQVFSDDVVCNNKGFLTEQESLQLCIYFIGSGGTAAEPDLLGGLPFSTIARNLLGLEYVALVPEILGQLEPTKDILMFTVDKDVQLASLELDLRTNDYYTDKSLDLDGNDDVFQVHLAHYNPSRAGGFLGKSQDKYRYMLDTTRDQNYMGYFLKSQLKILASIPVKFYSPLKICANQMYGIILKEAAQVIDTSQVNRILTGWGTTETDIGIAGEPPLCFYFYASIPPNSDSAGKITKINFTVGSEEQ